MSEIHEAQQRLWPALMRTYLWRLHMDRLIYGRSVERVSPDGTRERMDPMAPVPVHDEQPMDRALGVRPNRHA